MNGEIMTYKPPIRSALLGASGAIAVLLTGFTPIGATAATQANAQQSHPIAATHATAAQPQLITGKAALDPCDDVEDTDNPLLGFINGTGLVNLRNGPSNSCPVIEVDNAGDPVQYYWSYGAWMYVTDENTGNTGWMLSADITQSGGTPPHKPHLRHHP
jgi:hypothetical protein